MMKTCHFKPIIVYGQLIDSFEIAAEYYNKLRFECDRRDFAMMLTIRQGTTFKGIFNMLKSSGCNIDALKPLIVKEYISPAPAKPKKPKITQGRLVDDAAREKIKTMYNQGISAADITRELNLTKYAVVRTLSDLAFTGEISRMAGAFNSNINKIKELYESGKTYVEISEELQLSMSYVGKLIRGMCKAGLIEARGRIGCTYA